MSSARPLPRMVLHVMNSAGGGAALSTIELIGALGARGIASCAACNDSGSRAEQDTLREAVEGRVRFFPLYWWNRKIRARLWKRPLLELLQSAKTGGGLLSAARVARFARAQGVELIHTNTLTTPEGGMAGRRLSLPHVWHVREMVGPGRPFRFPWEGRRLGDYLARRASLVVANSHAAAACIQGWLPEGLLEVVPNGLDLARFSPRRHAPARQPLVVAMVGSLGSTWKKHRLFLEAAALAGRVPGVEFRLYGHEPSHGGSARGGGYAGGLRRRAAELGLGERLRWRGFVADPAAIMAEIDVLVHPADHESFGRVVVEAMAAGVPVVGVRGGGVGELVDDGVTGVLCPPDDPPALAAGIDRLVGDAALRERLGLAGRARAEQHYSLERCAAQMVACYERAMQRPLGRRQPLPGGAR